MLRLDHKWVWDFWLARDGANHHVFYLQAPRALGDPELRHHHATVGHAVSTDLSDWTVLPDALVPGPAGAWDDLATWTGSIIRHDARWWCFYTGVAHAERGLVQRIGAATSDDLTTWDRHPDNPLIELDPVRYEALDLSAWHDQAWRDPWVVRVNGRFEAFLTARAAHGPTDGRGVIGRAHSCDLVDWQIAEPFEVSPAGQFGHMEVPQIVEIDGRWFMLFCTAAATHSSAWRDRTDADAATGTFYAVGDSPTGPFTLVDCGPIGPDDGTTCFAGRIVTTDAGPRFLAWRMLDADGRFAGELIDPIPVGVGPDGRLSLDA